MDESEVIKSHLLDLANRAYRRNIIVYTDFLDLHELHILQYLGTKKLGVDLALFGGYEEAERQMAAFLPDALVFYPDFPMDCICISPLQKKFAEPLTHRDYLGAIMHLGIERSCIGDILLDGCDAYVFCKRSMTDMLMHEICRVRHTDVMTTLKSPEEVPGPKTKTITGTVQSVRLDSMISLAFNLSRTKVIPYIENGSVFVDGQPITTNAYTPQEGCRISVRGLGKFRFTGTSSLSKKGRIWIEVALYV